MAQINLKVLDTRQVPESIIKKNAWRAGILLTLSHYAFCFRWL